MRSPLPAREGGIGSDVIYRGAKREGLPTFSTDKTTYEEQYATQTT